MDCMGEEIEHLDQSRVDEIIWRNADIKSARQIAEMTGLRPEEILRRKKELVDEIDDLEIKAIRARLLIDLQSIARKTQEDYDKSPFEFKAGLMNSAIASMKLVLSELNRMDKADTSRVDALNQKRVSELVALMREVVDISVVEIAAKYDLDEDDLYEVFNRRMLEAAEKRDLA